MNELVEILQLIVPNYKLYNCSNYINLVPINGSSIYLRTTEQLSNTQKVIYNKIDIIPNKIVIGLCYYYNNIKFYSSKQLSDRFIFCFIDNIRISIPLQ